MKPKEVCARERVLEKDIIGFIEEFIDTHKRLQSLIPESRRIQLPDFLTMPHQINIKTYNDGVIINFRKRIKSKKYSINFRRINNNMGESYPFINQKENCHKINARGICISNMCFVKEEVLKYYQLKGGTNFKIPNNWGLVEVSEVGDVRFEKVRYYWIEKRRLRQSYFNRFWIFGSNDSINFTIEKARKQAANEFIPHLISKNINEIIKKRDANKMVKVDLINEVEIIEQEYNSFLSRDNLDESEIQDFLEKHLFILNPLYLDYLRKSIVIKSQEPLGERIVDFFMIRILDPQLLTERINLIEIKKPNVSLFSSTGLSSYLRKAISQLVESFEWIEKNLNAFTIPSISKIYGLAIVGRKNECKQYYEKEVTRARINSEIESLIGKWKEQIRFITFDDLLPNIEYVKNIFSNKIKYPVVVVGSSNADFIGTDSETIQRAVNHLSKIIDKKEHARKKIGQ